MTTIIILIGLGLYVALYYTYGKKVERDVVKANDSAETPAKRLFDGIDFVPARREVLLGHHFASIAGAAPIVGPAIAMAWGWVPGLLWVWFGNIFVGAIHDYLALMASIRYDGKSIQFVASDLMGKRTGKSFYGIVFVLLLLIGWRGVENCCRNLPSCVNLRMCVSPWPFPPIHTLSLLSSVMPWLETGQSYPWPGPPHEFTRFPSGSNSRIGGAARQHSAIGGLAAAPASVR